MIRIRYTMQTKTSIIKVFLENPHHFITVGQAEAYIKENKKWLTNAEVVEETIRILSKP